jgi:hypothetical protein
VINYYQKARHVFGRIKLEVLDEQGNLIDTLPAGKRKGINRVVWPMVVKPPRVPTAAQAAYSATSGPRVVPGTYTVRLTKGEQVIEEKLAVGLDRRATFTADDRKLQYEAVMRAHALFGRMSDLVDRLNGVKALAEARKTGLAAGDPTLARLTQFVDSIEALRKEIVATTEGGNITGEERLREHLDYVYGALNSYEGRPADYQVERVNVLEQELKGVEDRVSALLEHELPRLNDALRQHGIEEITVAGADVEGARVAASRALAAAREEGAVATLRAERD